MTSPYPLWDQESIQPPAALVQKRERSASQEEVFAPSSSSKRRRSTTTDNSDTMNGNWRSARGYHQLSASHNCESMQEILMDEVRSRRNTQSPIHSDEPAPAHHKPFKAYQPITGRSPSPDESTIHNRGSAINLVNPPKPAKSDYSPPSPGEVEPLPPIPPSFRSLFTVCPWSRTWYILVLALFFSFVSAGVQPFIAIMMGDVFQAFTEFPPTAGTATEEQKKALMRSVGQTIMKFALTAGGGTITVYLMNVLWGYFGEYTAEALRRKIFDGVQNKPMKWFDTGMGLQGAEKSSNEIGAGGLMGKFARETDEVRMAGLAFGLTAQYSMAIIICIVIGFVNSPLLALVVLAPYPIVTLIHGINQRLQAPLSMDERRAFAEASSLVDRTTNSIATVKAFNAQTVESNRFTKMVNTARNALYRQGWRWATTNASVTFLLLFMFAVGFWYAIILVAQGKSTVAKTTTAFWACLFASAMIQTVTSQLLILTKGKMSLASLLTVIRDEMASPTDKDVPSPTTPSSARTPAICRGAFDFNDVCFAYPSRPNVPVLRGLTLFVPTGEMTFIVGGSGSGKSTIAQLLLRMYEPDSGVITLDNLPLSSVPREYSREHIAAVQQGCILFDMTVHENVALGLVGSSVDWRGAARRPEDVTREEVIEACQMAHIHDFIDSLPNGYDTKLGHGGSELSGGQRQRLAIARARIRDPTVLILDEATSALDVTSRVDVFEDIKKWRQNRTTIVITHDLTQIGANDFVYVMSNGMIEEQGYRADLMKLNCVFATMAKEQVLQPLPPRTENAWRDSSNVQDIIEDAEVDTQAGQRGRPLSISSFYGLGDEYLGSQRQLYSVDSLQEDPSGLSRQLSRRESNSKRRSASHRRESSSHFHARSESATRQSLTPAQRRLSWTSEDLHNGPYRRPSSTQRFEERFQESKIEIVTSDPPLSPGLRQLKAKLTPKQGGTLRLIPRWYPTIPNKPLFFVALAAALAFGMSTPIFSFSISRLIVLLGSKDTSLVIPRVGQLVGVAAGQAVAEFMKVWMVNRVGAQWTAQIRREAFEKVMMQDMKWFDEPEHSPPRLVQNLIKDVDDMRLLIGSVLPAFLTIIVLLVGSFAWAMATSWRLTLVGLAIAPVFISVIMLSDAANGFVENRNKRYREAVAKTFYEAVANIRGIRAMALESSFYTRFVDETARTRSHATTKVWLTAIGFSLNLGMPLFSQVVMLYAGAAMMRDGLISFATLILVYTLILFAINFSSQVVVFLPQVAKSRAAAADFDRIHSLGIDTVEKSGFQRYPIRGDISFENVSFSYPTRPDVPVLRNLSLVIRPYESIAIVGPSGSGKSTIAALIQRLYEPTSGIIRFGEYTLGNAEVTYLRNHIAVVSQTANLFDASVAENVSYGAPSINRAEIIRACKDANINGFILSLPDGYDTRLGENAALISGGQAQRLQIARALVRHAVICILDECTSALDVENQRILLDTISHVKETSTTIFITHSIEAMRRCDRIVCLDEGRVAEEGTFDELAARGGVFAKLMQTGEWS